MSYLPCENPNCKSYGQPHPNCRCHGDLAEGGDVSFCSRSQAHQSGCEYFADGGDVIDPATVVMDPDPDEIDPATVVMDDVPGEEIDPATVVMDEGNEDNINLSPAELQAKMVEAANPDGTTPHATGMQQLAGAAEGLAEGLIPGAKLAEVKLLGVPKEDIEARESENPVEHNLARTLGYVIGPGKAIRALGSGSKILSNAIATGVFQGGDEVTKWALGEGDPEDGIGASLVRTSLATILGGVFGAAEKAAPQALKWAAENKLGDQAQYFLYGLANAASAERQAVPEALGRAATRGFKAGQKMYDIITGKLVGGATGAGMQAKKGWDEDGAWGALKGAGEGFAEGVVASLGIKGVTKASMKVVAPAILKVMSTGAVHGVTDAVDHALNMAAGSKSLDRAIETAFRGASSEAQQAVDTLKLEKYLEDGGHIDDLQSEMTGDTEAAGFAKGGGVESQRPESPNGVATHYPEQNVLMQAARGRMINYLTSLKPQKHAPKLAFDDEPDTREQEKSYKKALKIAVAPLNIMDDVGKGTLDVETLKHFNALHPELGGLVQKRLMKKIVEAQVDGKKPPYRVRQSMSLMLGTPLSGEMTPANIQAAQQTFVRGDDQKKPGHEEKPKSGSKNTLSKSDRAYLTDDQARESRQQRG